jgi:3-oxoadipate enol-lactonase
VPRAETNGITTYYEDSGEGPPVILIHGHSLDLRMWKSQVAPLIDLGFRVVRYDVRGHGRTTTPPTGYSWDNYSLDLAALLDGLGLKTAQVVGLSMGGGVALKFTLDNPRRVQSLTLVDTTLPGFSYSDGFTARILALRTMARTEGVEAALKRLWLPHPIFDGLRRHPERFAEVAEMVAGFKGLEYLEDTAERGYVQTDIASRLGELTTATLVIVGEDDLPDFRLITEVIAANLPGARHVVLPDSGHVPPMENPEAFNRVLLPFLTAERGATA